MRVFLPVFTCFILCVSCFKEPAPVTQPVYPDCSGKLSFRKDTTLAQTDTLDNSWIDFDTSIYSTNLVSRMDLRIVEKKTANMLVLTAFDLNSPSTLTTGNYFSGSPDKPAYAFYYLPEYKASKYLVDSLLINLTNFDALSGKASGTFTGRMIDSTKKDTIRIRKGEFDNICVIKRTR